MKRHSIAPFVCSALLVLAFAVCHDAQAAIGATIDVTTTADDYDIAVPNATCSLREAVQSANEGADRGGCTHFGSYAVSTQIVLGSSTYLLTRIGLDDDANLTSDLDITDSVTISGNGADITFIAGGNSYSGRVLHVVSGTVQLKNLTLKNGDLPGGRSGGGLLTELGTTTTLNGVTVRHNSADGDAGGILNRGTMTLTSSTVTDNHALNCSLGGGGLFNDAAELTLIDSRVDGNSAHGDEAHGGGIYSASKELVVDNTTVANNSLSTTASGIVSGGGIYTQGALLQINQSTVSGNSVVGQGGTAVGGGGMDLGGSGAVSRSVISGNSVTNDNAAFGGGARIRSSLIEVADSVIDDNSVDAGAGNGFAGGIDIGSARVVRSTISNNSALGNATVGCGGGALMAGLSTLVDSTVVDNHADGRGGGICLDTSSLTPVVIASSTITGNESNADGIGGGAGGGLSVGTSTLLELNNTVVAGNLENGAGDHDDCDGTIVSLGQVLVQQTNGCAVTGGAGNLSGVDPQLGALADNGGPFVGASTGLPASLLTRLPLNGSPLIDAGDPAGCKDDNGDMLDLDQRGFVRAVDGPDADTAATCDIGAAEFASLPDSIFGDGFE